VKGGIKKKLTKGEMVEDLPEKNKKEKPVRDTVLQGEKFNMPKN
jgi:hypothetical protein